MTPREKLQAAYELAFHPPRLNRAWNEIKRGSIRNRDELVELLDMALLLHQALPEDEVASPQALRRLALYQARARSFGMVRFLKNVRKSLGQCDPVPPPLMPGWMVRDIGLPPLARERTKLHNAA